MNPQDLLAKTILSESKRSGTDFKEVLHRGLPRTTKVEYGDFRKPNKSDLGDVNIQDEISFTNINTKTVNKGDAITFNDEKYYVEYFSPVVDEIFNVFAIKKTRTGNAKR